MRPPALQPFYSTTHQASGVDFCVDVAVLIPVSEVIETVVRCTSECGLFAPTTTQRKNTRGIGKTGLAKGRGC